MDTIDSMLQEVQFLWGRIVASHSPQTIEFAGTLLVQLTTLDRKSVV